MIDHSCAFFEGGRDCDRMTRKKDPIRCMECLEKPADFMRVDRELDNKDGVQVFTVTGVMGDSQFYRMGPHPTREVAEAWVTEMRAASREEVRDAERFVESA